MAFGQSSSSTAPKHPATNGRVHRPSRPQSRPHHTAPTCRPLRRSTKTASPCLAARWPLDLAADPSPIPRAPSSPGSPAPAAPAAPCRPSPPRPSCANACVHCFHRPTMDMPACPTVSSLSRVLIPHVCMGSAHSLGPARPDKDPLIVVQLLALVIYALPPVVSRLGRLEAPAEGVAGQMGIGWMPQAVRHAGR